MYNQWIEELYTIINNGIDTLHPYGGLNGAGKIFTGSYDWHSCVHAHWASVSIDKYFQRPVQIESRLSLFNIQAEFDYLITNPNFESPYGRSWMLLLLSQLNQAKFESLQKQLYNEIMEWLKNSKFPESKTIIGTHNSWMFSYFLVLLSSLISRSSNHDLDELYTQKLTLQDKVLEVFDQNQNGITWDFIERSCLYATIKLLKKQAITEVHLQNLIRIRDEFLSGNYDDFGKKEAHIPGRLAMISWPFALFDPQSHQNILYKMKEHNYFYEGDFHCFSHWIPQFIWMSIYLQNIRIFSR